MLSVDYVKHLYNPSYTLVQPGLYVYCMVMYYISSQLSQAIYNNTIIWSDMNIIKNIDFTRTEVSCSTTCSEDEVLSLGNLLFSGDLIDCS